MLACSIPVLILYIMYTLLYLFYSCLDSVYYLYIVGLFYSCLDSVYYLYIVVLVLFLSRFCILSIHCCTCSIPEQVQQCIDNIQNRDRNRTSQQCIDNIQNRDRNRTSQQCIGNIQNQDRKRTSTTMYK
jgi:hypothetical protein